MEKVKYLILGAGPAGLTFANRLKQSGEDSFLVVERKQKQEDFADPVRWMEVLLILAEVIFSMSDGQK